MRELFLILVTAVVFAYVLFQWAQGCGETYIDSQGISHEYSCK
jgi:hypothetical protein